MAIERSEQVNIKLTIAERKLFQAEADREYRTLSEWVRWKILTNMRKDADEGKRGQNVDIGLPGNEARQ